MLETGALDLSQQYLYVFVLLIHFVGVRVGMIHDERFLFSERRNLVFHILLPNPIGQ